MSAGLDKRPFNSLFLRNNGNNYHCLDSTNDIEEVPNSDDQSNPILPYEYDTASPQMDEEKAFLLGNLHPVYPSNNRKPTHGTNTCPNCHSQNLTDCTSPQESKKSPITRLKCKTCGARYCSNCWQRDDVPPFILFSTSTHTCKMLEKPAASRSERVVNQMAGFLVDRLCDLVILVGLTVFYFIGWVFAAPYYAFTRIRYDPRGDSVAMTVMKGLMVFFSWFAIPVVMVAILISAVVKSLGKYFPMAVKPIGGFVVIVLLPFAIIVNGPVYINNSLSDDKNKKSAKFGLALILAGVLCSPFCWLLAIRDELAEIYSYTAESKFTL
mmetsp:Transcript_56625/g.64649  ORF Transcript_56625/g.64649 Transcript_56625/m.64649 type:complete len:325 (-) Transcript_56625:38-1012(-)